MEPLKTVAFADDEPGILKILQLACQSKYHVVGAVMNGAEAVILVKEKRPDILVLDLHMPQMDGLQALAQIAPLQHTAVVILTADHDPAVARRAMDAGACGYITKPLEYSHIVPAIESAWHHHQTVALLHEQAKSLTESLELRKLLEKAKGILMEQQGFTEEEAHRTMQKMSQDQGISLKELCRSLIQVKMILGSKARAKKNAA